MQDRRTFLTTTVQIAGAAALFSVADVGEAITAAKALPQSSPDELARDEAFWATFRGAFSPEPRLKWFNNLAFNPASASVHDAFLTRERSVNAWPLAHMKDVYTSKNREELRSRLAGFVNASADEIALMRNTTEAMVNVIFGLDLARGDEVVITNQDYGTFLVAWAQRARREGIVVREMELPVPAASMAELIDAFRKAITPKTRVVMCCHVSDPTGQIFPVRAIADLAHAAGAQLIVDGALSFGCMPVDVKAMDCDYYGTSLHKGMFAPTGTGFLYVRKDRIRPLWALFGSMESEAGDIRKLEHRGTAPVTAFASVGDALDLHEAIGTERIAARYRYLKRLWADRVSAHERCHLNVRLEPEHSCGIAAVRIDGIKEVDAYNYLYQKRGVSTWPVRNKAHPGLWISPYPFTTPAEIDVLVSELIAVAEKGLVP
jgi:isopenicillin-N epimerase